MPSEKINKKEQLKVKKEIRLINRKTCNTLTENGIIMEIESTDEAFNTLFPALNSEFKRACPTKKVRTNNR